MAFPKYKELANVSNLSDIEEELFVVQKALFEFKIKKTIEQKKKPHFYTHFKRRIAQLEFKKSILLKTQEIEKKQ